MNKEFFIVQRCWHSGPNITPPVDYLRLFVTRRDAEEAAFHSAHAWARQQSPADPSVKTLLLPSLTRANEGTSSVASYGFISKGTLFWVRSTFVSVTDQCERDVFGYAIVTEGVIGGTGNRNSRRGSEVNHGRIFLGTSTEARRVANQVCHHCTMNNPGRHSYVESLPIGKPPDYMTGLFLAEWPPQAQISSPSMMQGAENMDKRQNHCIQETRYHHHNTTPLQPVAGFVDKFTSNAEAMSKRRRISTPSMPSWQQRDALQQSEEEMVMT